jgi:hypothetical protein
VQRKEIALEWGGKALLFGFRMLSDVSTKPLERVFPWGLDKILMKDSNA